MYDSAKHYDDRAQHSMNTTVGEHPDTDKLDLMNTRAVKSQGESRTDMYYTTRPCVRGARHNWPLSSPFIVPCVPLASDLRRFRRRRYCYLHCCCCRLSVYHHPDDLLPHPPPHLSRAQLGYCSRRKRLTADGDSVAQRT